MPVVALLVEACQRIGRAVRAGAVEAEVVPYPALAVGGRIEEIAVGKVIPVGVVPGPRCARGQPCRWIIHRGAHVSDRIAT